MSTIDNFKEQISIQHANGNKDADILLWLQSQGLIVGKNTLRRRYEDWGLSKNSVWTTTPELVSQIEDLYLKNLLTDSQIAERVIDDNGYRPSARQVKQIRLQNHLQRRVKRDNDEDISTTRFLTTRAAVASLITTEGGRSFGAPWLQTTLWTRYGHNARLADIRRALRELDPNGVDGRNPRLIAKSSL